MKIAFFSLLMMLVFLVGCNQIDKKENTISKQTPSFIQPPIKNADVPYKEYVINAEIGDTLFYKTGSIILFPPNSFIDKDGNVIKGVVKVKYREFSNQMDFYLSGIPMNYDSSGKQYTFESAGMCEILSYKDSLPVFVNPKNKPEVNIATKNVSPEQRLYYLDTVQRRWVNKGSSIVTDLGKKTKKNNTKVSATYEEIIEPIEPEKATNKTPIIKIAIDPASFKELLVYDNLQFQLDPNEKNFNPKDTAGDWTDVELLKGSDKGLYTLKFSNANRSVSYSAKPVLEGKDYDKALRVFDQKNKEYQQKIAERLLKEKANKEKYLQDSITYFTQLEENKRIERLNAIIEIRNREIEKQNKIIEQRNKEIQIRKKEIEKQIQTNQEEIEKQNAIAKKIYEDFNKANNLVRSFQIDGFGIWNCDRVLQLNGVNIIAQFKDTKGNKIEINNIAVIYKSVNSIFHFVNKNIRVSTEVDNMIIGVYNGRFAYFTYKDFNKLNLKADIKEQTFIMTIVDEKENTYEYLKGIEKQ